MSAVDHAIAMFLNPGDSWKRWLAGRIVFAAKGTSRAKSHRPERLRIRINVEEE